MEHSTSGQMNDPFLALASGTNPDQRTLLETKVSHWGQHVSVSFSISIQCPQTQPHIEYAARLIFNTATRFVNDAVSRLDGSMPMLPTE